MGALPEWTPGGNSTDRRQLRIEQWNLMSRREGTTEYLVSFAAIEAGKQTGVTCSITVERQVNHQLYWHKSVDFEVVK